MSTDGNRLSRAHTTIEQALKKTTTGTRDRPRALTLLELALEHAEHWASVTSPVDGERGGSSHPLAVEEAQEIERVHRLAIRALVRIPAITRAMDLQQRELWDFIQRLTSIVDHTKLDEPLPGCSSCARVIEEDGKPPIGGHFAGVYEAGKARGLCRFCYDYEQSEHCLPTVKAMHLYHTQGHHSAAFRREVQAMDRERNAK